MLSSPRHLVLAPLVLGAAFATAHCQRETDAPPAAADSACCEITQNQQLPMGMGRIVVSYPDETQSTRLEVHAAGDAGTALESAHGAVALEIEPGTYDVTIGGRRVAGVSVQAAHDTRIRVGALHVFVSQGTRVDLLDPEGAAFGSGYGEAVYGLPMGSVVVQVAGQQGPVLIEDGKVTEF